MRRTEPSVYLVAETKLVHEGLRSYLTDIGAGGWSTDAETDAEELIEAGGRLCYRSWEPGLNPNVTKVRAGNLVYMGNILSSRHGSVLQHASASFIFHNVSRVFTHELVRHVAGTAVSQESLRYVRLTDIPFWFPSALAGDAEVVERGSKLVEAMEDFQAWLANRYGLDEPKGEFAFKKLITSAMRRFAPTGLSTGLLWTANFRALRHVIELRTATAAEEEIRHVFGMVAQIAKQRWPAAFQDFREEASGQWTPTHSKV